MKILFSNLGYARGISGSLAHHLALAGRNLFTLPAAQRKVLAQFRAIIEQERPELCCLVEIDSGSLHSGFLNQIQALMCGNYCFSDITSKYEESSLLARLPLHWGKSNGFLARQEFPFQRRYLKHGAKRLVYQIALPGITLFFAHFSLHQVTRKLQFTEMRQLVQEVGGEVIILADFNIMTGFDELRPLQQGEGGLQLLNRDNEPTFRFHRQERVLDLCLCSPALVPRTRLEIIQQPFSDHAALLLELSG